MSKNWERKRLKELGTVNICSKKEWRHTWIVKYVTAAQVFPQCPTANLMAAVCILKESVYVVLRKNRTVEKLSKGHSKRQSSSVRRGEEIKMGTYLDCCLHVSSLLNNQMGGATCSIVGWRRARIVIGGRRISMGDALSFNLNSEGAGHYERC